MLTKEFEKHAKLILETHFKKLFNLYREQAVRAPEAITNLSKKKLSIKEFHALRFGLDHPILPKKVKRDEIKTNIEKLAYSIKRKKDIKKFDDEFRDQIKFEVNKFVQISNRVCSTPQNKSLHRTLDRLQKNDKIKICKYDKGRGVAILDKTNYFGKLDSIIDDSSKFERINVTESKQHPVITKEASIS